MHGQILIEVRGNGPDLVMIHGWGMHRGVWGHIADRLSVRWRLHVVDLPGHGTSLEAPLSPDLAELSAMIVRQVPEAHWLGWSMGGLIALQAAIDYPARVKSLVLVATNPSFVSRDHWPDGVEEQVFRDFARDLEKDIQGMMNRFLLLETMGSDTARESFRRLKADLADSCEPDAHALGTGLSILQDSDYTSLLPGIKNRTLWIAGNRDKLVPPDAMRKAATLMPGGEFHCIRGAGHAPYMGHSAEFIDQLEMFLGKEQVP